MINTFNTVYTILAIKNTGINKSITSNLSKFDNWTIDLKKYNIWLSNNIINVAKITVKIAASSIEFFLQQ